MPYALGACTPGTASSQRHNTSSMAEPEGAAPIAVTFEDPLVVQARPRNVLRLEVLVCVLATAHSAPGTQRHSDTYSHDARRTTYLPGPCASPAGSAGSSSRSYPKWERRKNQRRQTKANRRKRQTRTESSNRVRHGYRTISSGFVPSTETPASKTSSSAGCPALTVPACCRRRRRLEMKAACLPSLLRSMP